MINYPKISIITPNFNKGEYLESTILSIINQYYPNLEYLIIDGGSTDNSLDIIKKYESYITFWISEDDNGVYDAIRKGAQHCSGEIMTWLGSDDMLHPKSLFTIAEIFSNYSQIDWLTGANSIFDDIGRTVQVIQSKYFSRLDLLSHIYKWIQQESTFWRRSLYEKAGGINIEYKYAGDLDLWIRFSRYAQLYNCDALIGGFRKSSGDQLSKNIDAYYLEASHAINAELEKYKNDKKKINAVFFKRRLAALLHIMRHRTFTETPSKEKRKYHLIFNTNTQKFELSVTRSPRCSE